MFFKITTIVFLVFGSGCAISLNLVDNGLVGIHVKPHGMDYSKLPAPKEHLFAKRMLGAHFSDADLEYFDAQIASAIYEAIIQMKPAHVIWRNEHAQYEGRIIFHSMLKHAQYPDRYCFKVGVLSDGMQKVKFQAYDLGLCWMGDSLRIGKDWKL